VVCALVIFGMVRSAVVRLAWGIGGVPRPGSRPVGRPLLYLDIDGVLNPLSPPDPEQFTQHTIDGLTVNISSEHGAWLNVIPMRIKRQALPYRGIKLIHVNPHDGVTRRHVDKLLAWSPPRRYETEHRSP
jgi:hypothetical protein